MSNLDHLIENGLSALKRGVSYEKWLKTMKNDVNWQGNENISIEQLWTICQYVIYTWIPSAQPECHICRECKWAKFYGNVDKNGNVESMWFCANWPGRTDEEGFCHEWKSR